MSTEINDEVYEAVMALVKVKDGQIKYKTGGHVVTWENLTPKLMRKRLSISVEQFDELSELLIEEHEAARVNVSEGRQFFHSPVTFCEHYMKQWGVCVKPDGGMTYNNPHAGTVSKSKASLVSNLKLELFDYNASIPTDPETGELVVAPLKAADLIQNAVDKLVADETYKAIGETRSNIAYDPNSDFDLDGWVKALLSEYGIDWETIPGHVVMFKHMLYTIKRGLFCLRNREEWPMHIFYSRRQGTGKTELLKLLCAPFPYAYSNQGKFSKLLEDKAFKAMVRDKVLVDFQELATPKDIRGPHGEIDVGVIADIKAAITSLYIEGRGLYTSENEKEFQFATFASSANMHIYDVLQDPGGMRRFWEYGVTADKSHLPIEARWTENNRILAAIEKAYRHINENDPYGFFYPGCPHYDEIIKIQESYAKSDMFSKFCEMNKVSVQGHEEEGYVKMALPSFIKKFNRWMERQGNNSWKATTIINLMSQKDIIPEREEINGKVQEVVYVMGTL